MPHAPRQAKPRGYEPSRRDTRPSSARRGYGRQWQKIRAQVLDSHPTCVACGAPANHVDHIVPLSAGGTHDLSNLQPLCHRCHSRKTAKQDGAFGNRTRGRGVPRIEHVEPVSDVVSTSRTRLDGDRGQKSVTGDRANRVVYPSVHSGKFRSGFSEVVDG